jgi:hypothetical protein
MPPIWRAVFGPRALGHHGGQFGQAETEDDAGEAGHGQQRDGRSAERLDGGRIDAGDEDRTRQADDECAPPVGAPVELGLTIHDGHVVPLSAACEVVKQWFLK